MDEAEMSSADLNYLYTLQPERKFTSLAIFALCREGAVMFFNDLFGYGQTHSCAATCCAGHLKKFVKYIREVFAFYALAKILHGKFSFPIYLSDR